MWSDFFWCVYGFFDFCFILFCWCFLGVFLVGLFSGFFLYFVVVCGVFVYLIFFFNSCLFLFLTILLSYN